jgi:hypothetical protein
LTDSKTLPHKNTQNVITMPVDPKEVRVSGLMSYMDFLLTIIYTLLQKSKHYKQGRSWGGGGVAVDPGSRIQRAAKWRKNEYLK